MFGKQFRLIAFHIAIAYCCLVSWPPSELDDFSAAEPSSLECTS